MIIVTIIIIITIMKIITIYVYMYTSLTDDFPLMLRIKQIDFPSLGLSLG